MELNVTDSKKNIFDLISPRYIQIWQSKEMSHDFVRGQSVAETGATVISLVCQHLLLDNPLPADHDNSRFNSIY